MRELRNLRKLADTLQELLNAPAQPDSSLPSDAIPLPPEVARRYGRLFVRRSSDELFRLFEFVLREYATVSGVYVSTPFEAREMSTREVWEKCIRGVRLLDSKLIAVDLVGTREISKSPITYECLTRSHIWFKFLDAPKAVFDFVKAVVTFDHLVSNEKYGPYINVERRWLRCLVFAETTAICGIFNDGADLSTWGQVE